MEDPAKSTGSLRGWKRRRQRHDISFPSCRVDLVQNGSFSSNGGTKISKLTLDREVHDSEVVHPIISQAFVEGGVLSTDPRVAIPMRRLRSINSCWATLRQWIRSVTTKKNSEMKNETHLQAENNSLLREQRMSASYCCLRIGYPCIASRLWS
jgi:hypothetical protein